MAPNIIYVPKAQLGPRFGQADAAAQIAYVREDLPAVVRRFVTVHELYHLQDRATWWIWREIKANAAAAWKHPVGFMLCVCMSLSPSRLWFYLQRIKRGF